MKKIIFVILLCMPLLATASDKDGARQHPGVFVQEPTQVPEAWGYPVPPQPVQQEPAPVYSGSENLGSFDFADFVTKMDMGYNGNSALFGYLNSLESVEATYNRCSAISSVYDTNQCFMRSARTFDRSGFKAEWRTYLDRKLRHKASACEKILIVEAGFKGCDAVPSVYDSSQCFIRLANYFPENRDIQAVKSECSGSYSCLRTGIYELIQTDCRKFN